MRNKACLCRLTVVHTCNHQQGYQYHNAYSTDKRMHSMQNYLHYSKNSIGDITHRSQIIGWIDWQNQKLPKSMCRGSDAQSCLPTNNHKSVIEWYQLIFYPNKPTLCRMLWRYGVFLSVTIKGPSVVPLLVAWTTQKQKHTEKQSFLVGIRTCHIVCKITLVC